MLRNPIRVDTRSPQVTRTVIAPTTFSPDGDGRNDFVTVRYTVDERAHGLLFVDGRRNTRTRFQRQGGVMRWNGKRRGHGLPAGTYGLSLAAEDTAGNVGPSTSPVPVRIRYIELGRPVVRVRTRARFGVSVLTDASSFHWRFAGGSGTARPGLLVLRAPRLPGRFTLFVAYDGHGASAGIVVTRRRPPPVARQ